jgi:hypothetical protein
MTQSRFLKHSLPARERLARFVAVDILTSQMPLIEFVRSRRKEFIRLWVAYDPERVCGTFMDIHPNGTVRTKTVYPGGYTESKTVRKQERKSC